MRYLRAFFATIMMATLAFVCLPTATATPSCHPAIADYGQEPTFDHSEVFTARHQLLETVPTEIEVYVHALETLSVDYAPSVYDEEFRETCNPATDYILVALDRDGLTQVIYGPHFDRLTPALAQVSTRYMADFYLSGTDKTTAVVNLLDNLRRTFEVNPDYANYHLHEQFYAPVYAPNLDLPEAPLDSPFWADTMLVGLIAFVVVGILVIIGAIVAMMRDPKDHRWK